MIVTVGSINMDLVVRVSHLPAAGETVLGSDYETHHGGKGANQAVAAARAAASVRMVGAVGNDSYAESLLEGLRGEGVDTGSVRRLEGKSGVAFINVDDAGQNNIVVSPGANARVMPEGLTNDVFDEARCVLLQLEIPLSTVIEAARQGKKAGAKVILNLAPAKRLRPEEMADVDVLVVNEVEAAHLLEAAEPRDPNEAEKAAMRLAELVHSVVMTLGSQGAVWCDGKHSGHLPGHVVPVKDTTAAGDAFVGMLAARLAAGEELSSAVRWANAAGALATTVAGAQPSLPRLPEVERFLEKIGSGGRA